MIKTWIDLPSGVRLEIVPGVFIMQITNEVMSIEASVDETMWKWKRRYTAKPAAAAPVTHAPTDPLPRSWSEVVADDDAWRPEDTDPLGRADTASNDRAEGR